MLRAGDRAWMHTMRLLPSREYVERGYSVVCILRPGEQGFGGMQYVGTSADGKSRLRPTFSRLVLL